MQLIFLRLKDCKLAIITSGSILRGFRFVEQSEITIICPQVSWISHYCSLSIPYLMDGAAFMYNYLWYTLKMRHGSINHEILTWQKAASLSVVHQEMK